MNSDTPRTNAAIDCRAVGYIVPADFSRKLERELTIAQATIARLEGEKAALQTEQQGVVSWSESACDICGKTTMIIGKKLETEP